MLGGESKQTVAAVEPPKAAEVPSPPAAPPAATSATDTSTTQDATAPAASPPMIAPGPATGAESSKAVPAAPTGVPPLPGRPPTAAEPIKADSGQTKAPSKAAPPGSEAPSKVASPPGAPTSPPSKALAKAPAAAPAPDRWQMMAEAMAQCSPAQFFSRLACEQRTRNRYCEGYWGQVPQCPSAPTKDHGQ
jgi:hypothetical protein